MVKNKLENIGILGGSFDPPHKGHLYVSRKSLKLLKLKKVIWAITKKKSVKKKSIFLFCDKKEIMPKNFKRTQKDFS